MDHDVEARLTRAGLTDEEIRGEFELFDGLDADGQRDYRAWLQQVSDDDIARTVRDGGDRVPVVTTHDTAVSEVDALTGGLGQLLDSDGQPVDVPDGGDARTAAPETIKEGDVDV